MAKKLVKTREAEVVIFFPAAMSDSDVIRWVEEHGPGMEKVKAYLEPTDRFDELLSGERSFSA